MDKYIFLELAVGIPAVIIWAWMDVRRKRKKRENSPLLNNTMRFVNGSHLVITVLNGGDYRLLAGHECNKANRSSAKLRCKRFWDITSLSTGMERIQALLDGGHNEVFLQEISYINENVVCLETEDGWQKLFANAEDKKTLSRLKTMHDALHDFGDSAIRAWDLSRVNHLLADFYLAGWIDKEYYMAETILVARKIQELYSSWNDFNKSYLYGYLWWSGEIPDHNLKKLGCYHYREKILRLWKDKPNSPFGLDWHTDLEKSVSPYV